MHQEQHHHQQHYFHVDETAGTAMGFHTPGSDAGLTGRDVSNQSPTPGAPVPTKRAIAKVTDGTASSGGGGAVEKPPVGGDVEAAPFNPAMATAEAQAQLTQAGAELARMPAKTADQEALFKKLTSLLGEVATTLRQIREANNLPTESQQAPQLQVSRPQTHVPVSSRPQPASAGTPFETAAQPASPPAEYAFQPSFGVHHQHPQATTNAPSVPQQQQQFGGAAQQQQFGGAAQFQNPRGAQAPMHRQPVGKPQPGAGHFLPHVNNWHAQTQMEDDGNGTIVSFVEFKRGRVKRFESVGYFAPGKYVIVDGDRGQDCGLVVHTCIRQLDGSITRSDTLDGVSIDLNKVKPETGRVQREANDAEIEMLHGEIATMERYALKTCRERVAAMGLNMDVVDCEFQFDRKKVTFFFDAPEAIDFRELTKDLFKTFGARIWLENINTKVKNVVPDGALSHADKVLYAERGLRAPPRR